MKRRLPSLAFLTLIFASAAFGQAAPPADPTGILRKPIPDKLVVLTFDDGPASGFTVVAPILKSFGFGGSFYVCDFDSFRTRKDWYLTWRQMRAMHDAGLEIGNHTTGHAGGAGIGAFLSLEDDLQANGVPKCTTIAWPLCAVNTKTYPDLAANGYIFGRGGHFRPYRPTVDNPFDIPCLGAGTVEEFVKNVRQANNGKVVVIIYHGVPDIEHPAVSLDPAIFKLQMQYLKDNNYKVIALRDLAQYIDPAKAAQLPPTANEYKVSGPVELVKEDKPYVAANIPATAPKPAAPAPKAVDVENSPVPVVTAIAANQPNVFTWNKAEAGNWSEASKWTNNLASGSVPVAAGQSDYVFHFDKQGSFSLVNDLNEGLVVNQLNFKGPSVKIEGKSLAFTANGSAATPRITQSVAAEVQFGVPVTLAGNLTVDVTDRNGKVIIPALVSGAGSLTKNGEGLLRLDNKKNTFTGGTTINRGCLCMHVANEGLGSGPITLNDNGVLALEHVNGANPLVLNGGEVNANNGFGDTWDGTITLNGNTRITSYADFVINASMSGPGGFTQIGTYGGFGLVNKGQVTLGGTNTYRGATVVQRGTLRILKAASLYNGDTSQWMPDKITVAPTATMRLCVGGPGEFTGEQIGAFLKNLASTINNNGLMERAVLCLDSSHAKEPVVIATDIADSKGPGGGAFLFKKCGAGILQMNGRNSYTGQTILEGGSLIVSSLNSYAKSNPSSSLGAPRDIETGEIVIGIGDAPCSLIYNGAGETTDRVMNLAGKNFTATFEQAGTGLLKLSSTFVLSGHSASKTIALKGDSAGTGEIAGNLVDPHDRAGKAVTAVAKSGSGTWTLSGSNSYSGPTTVSAGTLVIASAKSLGGKTEVTVASGAKLALNFKGQVNVAKLIVDGKTLPSGTYGANNTPQLAGSGFLKIP